MLLGDIHAIDVEPATWDAVLCLETIIHATHRPKVFSGAVRVLRNGGVFAFSDMLAAPGADLAKVDAAFARLAADPGATVNDYVNMARAAAFKVEYVEQRPHDIAIHYGKMAAALALSTCSGDPLVTSVRSSIASWQEALVDGHITWACCAARKME